MLITNRKPDLRQVWNKVKATAKSAIDMVTEDMEPSTGHEQRVFELMSRGQWKYAATLLQEMRFDKDKIKVFVRNYYLKNPKQCPPELKRQLFPAELPTAGTMAIATPQPKESAKPETSSAMKLLGGLVESCLSIVLAAPPGSGKTVTLHAWLLLLLTRKPRALVRVISFKNDSFLGLADVPGCVSVVDASDLTPVYDAIAWIESVLRERKMERSHSERSRIASECPAWLVLPDWYVITKALDSKSLNELQRRMAMIVTGGREFGVAIFVDTQSANLKALGFAEDASIRFCLHLVALGKYTRNEEGKLDGGFGAIMGALNNRYMFPSVESAEQLRQDAIALDKHSRQSGAVGFIATTGGGMSGILPDFRDVMGREIPQNQKAYLASQIKPMEDNPFGDGDDLLKEIEAGHDYRAMLARAVRSLIAGEKLSESEVIKQVLKMGGREYQSGKELLNSLQSQQEG